MLEGDLGGATPPDRKIDSTEGSLADFLHQIEHRAEWQASEHLGTEKVFVREKILSVKIPTHLSNRAVAISRIGTNVNGH